MEAAKSIFSRSSGRYPILGWKGLAKQNAAHLLVAPVGFFHKLGQRVAYLRS